MHNVLLVEDDMDTQANLCDILEIDGYEVQVAGSLKETLSRNDFTEFTAIILDRKLPDGTAEELLPHLSRLAPDVAVIVVTGQADLDGTIAALRHGAEDYILKPINPDALRASLLRIRKIRDSEERAQQAERLAVVGQMTAVLTHESRNILQRMSAFADMLELELERLPQNQEALDYLSRMRSAGTGLGSLLEEVRNYAAPIKLDRTNCCVSAICNQAWRAIAPIREGRDAELIESKGETDSHCLCDSFRMEQVFRNLLENAISACSDPVRIKVSSSDVEIAGIPALRITISDNGPGLSSEDEQRLFEAFYTTKHKGTGLGMAIVKRVVEAHRGTVVVGDAGRGATFVITLPRATPPD